MIITGYMTHMCLNSTTRAATEAGYRCTVVAELTTTWDLPDGKGGVIPAAMIKAVHLAGLADRFAIAIERSDDLVEAQTLQDHLHTGSIELAGHRLRDHAAQFPGHAQV